MLAWLCPFYKDYCLSIIYNNKFGVITVDFLNPLDAVTDI